MLIAMALQPGSPVTGPNWVETGESADVTIFIDTANIERRGDVARVWSWSRYATALEDGTAASFFQNDYDCRARTYSLIAYRAIDARGDLLDAGTIPAADRTVRPVNEGTTAEYELELVCASPRPGLVMFVPYRSGSLR